MVDENVVLIGVYDADGSFAGELRYWLGARFGRTHCSLCEITHGLFREKSEWRDCRESLNLEFVTFHRDDAPREVLDACNHELPVVVARKSGEFVVVLRAVELEALKGDVEKFHSALEAACAGNGIDLA